MINHESGDKKYPVSPGNKNQGSTDNTNQEPADSGKPGIHIESVGRDLKVRGDIVAGNKVVIQNIIRQAAERIITAPYKFLSSYDVSDRFIFFGRTAVVEELAGRIPRHKVLIINGQSGSGKTSLINAGLIPHLADNGYFYVTFRDYSDPILQLREYFTRSEKFRLDGTYLLSLYKILWAINHKQKSRIVVVLDQFERFLVNVPTGLRRRFILEFKECMDSDLSTEEMNFIFSIRQEFFGQLLREFEDILPGFLNDTIHYNLKPLSREEAREAIIDPLRYIPNIGYKEKFVDEILLPSLIEKTAGEEKIEPPHLQIVCDRLYEEARNNLKKSKIVEIDYKLYEKLGGTQKILQDYLDHCVEVIVEDHDPQKVKIVHSILKLMIETTGTRKFVTLTDIRNGLPDVKDFTLIKVFIKRLENARIIEARGEEKITNYSLSHEFMVEKIQEWIDDREMNRKRAQETLKRGISEWKSSKTFLNKKQIHIIRTWAVNINEEEKRFIRQSGRACMVRSLKMLSSLLFLLIIAGFLGYKFVQWQKISKAERLANSSFHELEKDPTLSFRLAEAALKIRPTLINAKEAVFRSLEYPLYNTLEGHNGNVKTAIFSAKGNHILTASNDNTARVWNAFDGALVRILEGHTRDVVAAHYSPDGEKILTTSSDGTSWIWDTSSWKLLRPLKGHTKSIRCVRFSRDGKFVVTVSWDETARIWDVESGNEILCLKGHTYPISAADFSPDGKSVLTSSCVKTVLIWDLSTDHRITKLEDEGHTAGITKALFSPNGDYILSVSNDNTAQIWNTLERKVIYALAGHKSTISSAAFSSDGEKIVTASEDTTARIWDVKDGSFIELKGHTATVTSAFFSEDGNSVITASADNTARIWNITTGEEIYVLKGHKTPVNYARFSSDGERIVTVSEDGTAKIWNSIAGRGYIAGQYIHVLQGETESVCKRTFSPDGKRIIAPVGDQTAHVWEVTTGDEYPPLKGHSDVLTRALFSPNGEQVVTTSNDMTARVWNSFTGKMIRELKGHTDNVMSADFSPDGKQIVTASYDKTACVWDTVTWEKRHILKASGGLLNAHFSHNGCHIITCGIDPNVYVWDAASGARRTLNEHTDTVNCAQFSPDDKWCLTASVDKTVRIWDISKREDFCLRGHTSIVNSAQFSPDGKLIVTASNDKTARLWNISKREQISVLTGHSNAVNTAFFSPDGERIITTCSEDNTAFIWDVATGEKICELNGHKEGLVGAVFSPKGKWIVTASKDKTLRIWPGNAQEVLRLINKVRIRGKVQEFTERELAKYKKKDNNL